MHRIITPHAPLVSTLRTTVWKPRVYTRVGGLPALGRANGGAGVVGVVHLFSQERDPSSIIPWRSLFYGFFAARPRPTMMGSGNRRRLPKTTHALPAGVVLLVR